MTPKTRWQAAMLGIALAIGAPAAADEWNQKTLFTFSDSVELPGKTVPAGTYTFRLLDSPSTRNIVQVFNENETELITTLLAVPAERREATDDAIVSFAERSQDAPPAVQFWFYPGRTIGHEFVYPREQAMRIARAANTPVLATDAGSDAESMRSGRLVSIDPEGRESQYTDRAVNQDERRAEATDEHAGHAGSATATAQEKTEAAEQWARPQPDPTADATRRANAQAAQAGQSTEAGRTAPSVQSGQSATSGSQADTRPDRLPETASGEPMLLLLAVSSFLGLGALDRMRRGF